MLDDAVAAFLDGVSERDFDEPLMALLRAEGYTDVRLVHGQVEAGKDVIAKRDGQQWVLQSKAGNLNHTEFRKVREQLYDLRMSDIGAPGFDKNMPRRAVLVQTGRMTGQAPIHAQEYERQCVGRGENPIEFWNKDMLLARLSGNPDAVLRGGIDGQLLGLIGAIDAHEADMDAIETFSRRWARWEPLRFAGLGIIEASLVCERLKGTSRLDLACHVALCAVRSSWAAGGTRQRHVAGAAAFPDERSSPRGTAPRRERHEAAVAATWAHASRCNRRASTAAFGAGDEPVGGAGGGQPVAEPEPPRRAGVHRSGRAGQRGVACNHPR